VLLREYWSLTGERGSAHVRGSGHLRTPSVGLKYRFKSPSQAGEITVVETAVVEVVHELAQQPLPVAAGRCERDVDFDAPLHDLHGGQTRGRRPAPRRGAGRWLNTTWESVPGCAE
jgi:hypothetical protein